MDFDHFGEAPGNRLNCYCGFEVFLHGASHMYLDAAHSFAHVHLVPVQNIDLTALRVHTFNASNSIPREWCSLHCSRIFRGYPKIALLASSVYVRKLLRVRSAYLRSRLFQKQPGSSAPGSLVGFVK